MDVEGTAVVAGVGGVTEEDEGGILALEGQEVLFDIVLVIVAAAVAVAEIDEEWEWGI